MSWPSILSDLAGWVRSVSRFIGVFCCVAAACFLEHGVGTWRWTHCRSFTPWFSLLQLDYSACVLPPMLLLCSLLFTTSDGGGGGGDDYQEEEEEVEADTNIRNNPENYLLTCLMIVVHSGRQKLLVIHSVPSLVVHVEPNWCLDCCHCGRGTRAIYAADLYKALFQCQLQLTCRQ